MNSHRLTAGFISNVEVDTILTNPIVTPGGTLDGEVHFRGGRANYNIATLSLEFLATLDIESGNPHYPLTIPFGKVELASEFTLAAGSRQVVPFSVSVPWFTPINTVGPKQLKGVSLGVYTGMRMGGTFNENDSDPLQAAPFPIQEQLLRAMERAGFMLNATDLEDIRITPTHTSFAQKIKYVPSREISWEFRELKMAFIGNPDTVDVLLESDTGARHQFAIAHADAAAFNADALLTPALLALGAQR